MHQPAAYCEVSRPCRGPWLDGTRGPGLRPVPRWVNRHENTGSSAPRKRVRVTVPVCGTATSAVLPSSFTEILVASGLTSPTAMEFAPDGRLFVCQQGGQLRVIKNGVAPCRRRSSRDGEPRRRARPARHRVRPGLRRPTGTSTSTTPPRAGGAQPRQPLHRRTATWWCPAARCRPRSRQRSRRHEPQRRRDPLRRGRQALRRRRRERRRRQRADAHNRLGKMLRINPNGSIPRTTRSSARPPASIARSGRWGCATRSRSRSSRVRADLHQRRRPGHVGGDQRRRRRRQLRLADAKGPT